MASDHSLLLTRIAARLHELFDSYIDLKDVAGKPAEHQEGFFLSRALAALALMDQADLSPEQAGACVTDGGADDGIDAVYVDEKQKVIYFVQSKWRTGSKSISLSDFTRFRDGVKNALGLNWNNDNANLHKFAPKIEKALKDIDTGVAMLFAHTSENPISKDIRTRISDFLAEQNKYLSDFLKLEEIDLTNVAHIARSKTRASNIDLTVLLSQWGMLTKPYKAVYGRVSAQDVAKWHDDHGYKLFVENLRYVIEKSEVNEGIAETAEKEPQNFWYFNNGITAICDSFEKQPIGGTGTDSGAFDIKKISIINGAQTVGSLSKAKASGIKLDDVYVHVRVISLVGTPEGFATSVTRSNNTQNDLNPVDFVSFDPNQERIRKEAAQDSIIYSYRRGEVEPDHKNGFDIRSATVAAACASGDLRLAVSAKRYISGLWENIKKEPYTKLFNESTSAAYLWNLVKLMRAVDAYLAGEAEKLTGRDRLIAVHGNRFILFYVFSHMSLAPLHVSGADLNAAQQTALQLASECLKAITPQINKMFPDSYPGNIFKNQDRQSDLLKAIEPAKT